jgi:hypothetical protein
MLRKSVSYGVIQPARGGMINPMQMQMLRHMQTGCKWIHSYSYRYIQNLKSKALCTSCTPRSKKLQITALVEANWLIRRGG